MGIDIYAKWRNQTKEESEKQYTGFSTVAGKVGYLREAYHGGPYVTKYLLQEGFKAKDGTAKIPAYVLRERLPKAVALAMFRNAKVYSKGERHGEYNLEDEGMSESLASALKKVFETEVFDESGIEMAEQMDEKTVESMQALIAGGALPDYAQAFVDFVWLCEVKEAELGEPCEILVSA